MEKKPVGWLVDLSNPDNPLNSFDFDTNKYRNDDEYDKLIDLIECVEDNFNKIDDVYEITVEKLCDYVYEMCRE